MNTPARNLIAPKGRRRQISVERLMAKAEVNRTTAIKVMKAMEFEGLGEFVKGVRGYPTRLEMV